MNRPIVMLRRPWLFLLAFAAGLKASGAFLIEQARLVATNVHGVIIEDSGHWLMEEAPQQVIPLIVAFINDQPARAGSPLDQELAVTTGATR